MKRFNMVNALLNHYEYNFTPYSGGPKSEE